MVYYDNIVKRVRERQRKAGINYPEKDGGLYNALKFFYIVGFVFATVTNLMYIFGMLLAMSEDVNWNINVTDIILVSVCVVLMIAALVASKFNDNVIVASIFGVVNLGCGAFLSLLFLGMQTQSQNGLQLNYYWRHLAPLSVMALCALGMAVIVIVAHFKFKKAYNSVLEHVYNEYNSLPDGEKPEWEEYVKNYEFGQR